MNNENNNNGTVLGGVNPNPVPTNGVDSLGTPTPVGPVNSEGVVNPIPNPEPINPTPTPVEPTMPSPTVPPVAPEPVNPIPAPSVNLEEPSQPMPQTPVQEPTPVPPVNPTEVPPVGQPLDGAVGGPVPLQPNVEPTPAYTNPQAVNPTPGFESSNVIGSNPPMSFEPEKAPKKKSNNKKVFIIIVLLVLAGVGFGTYYVLNYTNILTKNSSSVNIKTNDLEINLGSELSTNIADYATITGTDAKNCSLSTINVNANEAGVYEYTVTCGEMHKNGKVTVVDNTELKVALNTVYKSKGANLEASEFAKTGSSVKLEFVDSSEVEKYLSGNAGTYTVKLKATEDSKTSEVEGKLVVLDHELKGFLICTSKEQNVENSNAKMTVGESFVIVADGTNNIFGNIAQEIHTFTFSDVTEYDALLEKYNKGEEISINNITGEVSFNDEEKSVTIANDKSVSELTTEYGAETLKTYSSIRTHFTTNLGYTCKFSK